MRTQDKSAKLRRELEQQIEFVGESLEQYQRDMEEELQQTVLQFQRHLSDTTEQKERLWFQTAEGMAEWEKAVQQAGAQRAEERRRLQVRIPCGPRPAARASGNGVVARCSGHAAGGDGRE